MWTLLTGSKIHVTTWAEVLHAAVTVGRANTAHVMRHGGYSWMELSYRASMILANLKEAPRGQILSTGAYRGLDPSEKGAVSYFVGLMAAKLLASTQLEVPWLMHLDAYRGVVTITRSTTSKRRPDLFGPNAAGRWVAIEAKGRSGTVPSGLMDDAKEQAENVSLVNGASPLCRVASLSGFDGDAMHVEFADPPNERSNARRLAITLLEDEYLRRYYQVLLTVLQTADEGASRRIEVGGQTFDCVSFLAVDLTVGINQRLRQRLEQKKAITASEVDEMVGQARVSSIGDQPAAEREDAFAGRDGIAVQLGRSWTVEQMRLEPVDRVLRG